MTNFNRFIAIDWSGAKSPIYSTAISVSEAIIGQTPPQLIHQKWSRTNVYDYIQSLLLLNEKIFIGIDCNFGYPTEFINYFNNNLSAFDIWKLVDNTTRHQDNFFAGDFCKDSRFSDFFWVEKERPQKFIRTERITETACKNQNLGHPESPFKLIGAKQIGKSGLSGMRLAHHLRKNHSKKIAFWPFDDQQTLEQAQIIISEIFPQCFIKMAHLGNQKIKSNEDLNLILKYFDSEPYMSSFVTDHDSDSIISSVALRHLLTHSNQFNDFHSYEFSSQIRQEGWIFGVDYRNHKSNPIHVF